MSVAEETRDLDFFHRQRFRFHLGAASVRFLLQRVHRGDAKNIAFQFARQIVVLKYDVQGLVPRHVIQNDRETAMHIGIEEPR